MKTWTLLSLALLSGCSTLQLEPERPHCYHRASGERRCFGTEEALSADVRREQLAIVRAVEERARLRALAVVAERDAREAAERARATVERSDRIQDDAFEILVEMREDARAAAPSPSEALYPAPQTPPAQ